VIGRKASTAMSESGSRIACDVTQFWQYGQWKSQPSMPKVSASDPGSTWKKGFFSTGSHCRAPT
jgi:hypothetical protein